VDIITFGEQVSNLGKSCINIDLDYVEKMIMCFVHGGTGITGLELGQE